MQRDLRQIATYDQSFLVVCSLLECFVLVCSLIKLFIILSHFASQQCRFYISSVCLLVESFFNLPDLQNIHIGGIVLFLFKFITLVSIVFFLSLRLLVGRVLFLICCFINKFALFYFLFYKLLINLLFSRVHISLTISLLVSRVLFSFNISFYFLNLYHFLSSILPIEFLVSRIFFFTIPLTNQLACQQSSCIGCLKICWSVGSSFLF